MSVRGRMIAKGVIMLIGAALLAASCLGWVEEFWSGMGVGLAVVGAIQLIRLQRYRRDPQYREKMDVEVKDERNKFLSMKAWSWAGFSVCCDRCAGLYRFQTARAGSAVSGCRWCRVPDGCALLDLFLYSEEKVLRQNLRLSRRFSQLYCFFICRRNRAMETAVMAVA